MRRQSPKSECFVLQEGKSFGSRVNCGDNGRPDQGIIQIKGLELQDAVYQQTSKEELCYLPIYIYEVTICVCGFSPLLLYTVIFFLCMQRQDKTN